MIDRKYIKYGIYLLIILFVGLIFYLIKPLFINEEPKINPPVNPTPSPVVPLETKPVYTEPVIDDRTSLNFYYDQEYFYSTELLGNKVSSYKCNGPCNIGSSEYQDTFYAITESNSMNNDYALIRDYYGRYSGEDLIVFDMKNNNILNKFESIISVYGLYDSDDIKVFILESDNKLIFLDKNYNKINEIFDKKIVLGKSNGINNKISYYNLENNTICLKDSNNKIGIINYVTNEIVVDYKYDWIQQNDKYYKALLNNKYSLYDSSNNKVINSEFDDIEFIVDNQFLIKNNGYYDIINSSNKSLLYDKFKSNNNTVFIPGYTVEKKDSTYYIIKVDNHDLDNFYLYDVVNKKLYINGKLQSDPSAEIPVNPGPGGSTNPPSGGGGGTIEVPTANYTTLVNKAKNDWIGKFKHNSYGFKTGKLANYISVSKLDNLINTNSQGATRRQKAVIAALTLINVEVQSRTTASYILSTKVINSVSKPYQTTHILNYGADCASLASWMLNKSRGFNNASVKTIYNLGKATDYKYLKAGDLAVYTRSSGGGHVMTVIYNNPSSGYVIVFDTSGSDNGFTAGARLQQVSYSTLKKNSYSGRNLDSFYN